MFIVPAEKALDWRRAPVVTASIAILCCLVFFVWQWGDQTRIEAAIQQYQESKLLALEYPNFVSHLHQTQRPQEAAVVEALFEDKAYHLVIQRILFDRSFAVELRKTDETFWGEDVYHRWRQSRTEINQTIEQVSAFKLGLVPAESRPITYLTYQFMHGDMLHIVGNLVVLVLVGLAVEAAIGSFNFLLCYLFCGVVAGGVFTLFNWNSFVPLVGASGAISGVMGMYAAIYGMRKIRFFYSLVFYFGYFTAPALLILPIWLAWEIISAIWGQASTTAYWAHAGGLLAGGAGMLLMRSKLVQVEESYLDSAPSADQNFRKALDSLYKLISQFQFAAAKRKLEEMEAQYGNRLPLLEIRYNLEKLDSNSPHFHRVTHKILSQPTTDQPHLHLLHEIYRDYSRFQGQQEMEEQALVRLMLGFCQIEQWETLQGMIKQAQERQIRHPMLIKVLQLLAEGIKREGNENMGTQYKELAESLMASLNSPDPST